MKAFLLCLMLLTIVFPAAAQEAPVTLFEAPQQVTLTFTGDCTLGNNTDMRGNESSFEAVVEANGYLYPFENVRALFQQDDLTIINLEGVLHDSEKGINKKTYNFRGPTAFAQMLPLNSIEVASLGNNHTADYQKPGYTATIDALTAQGVAAIGTTAYDHRTFVYKKGNVKIGFVSINISHWWGKGVGTQMKEAIQKLKEDDGCAVVIACIHAGVEYDVRHDAYQERMADAFLKNGADIVVGNHPHVIQGMRVENGKTTLWSLGNFVFGGNKEVRALRTYIARFTLSFDESGAYLGHQLNIIPAHISATDEYNNYQPVLVTDEEEAAKIIAAVQADSKAFKVQPYQKGIGALQEFVPAPNP